MCVYMSSAETGQVKESEAQSQLTHIETKRNQSIVDGLCVCVCAKQQHIC